jgi:hypothetical protein
MEMNARTNVGVKGENAGAPKKFRVQLDFENRDFQIISQLVSELDLNTRAELFRSGLRVLRWMLEKKKQGCTIVAITPDNRYLEPEFDFFRRFPTRTIVEHEKDTHQQEQEGNVVRV